MYNCTQNAFVRSREDFFRKKRVRRGISLASGPRPFSKNGLGPRLGYHMLGEISNIMRAGAARARGVKIKGQRNSKSLHGLPCSARTPRSQLLVPVAKSSVTAATNHGVEK